MAIRTFNHVRREEGEECLHISHLHKYVSAYECCPETIDRLVTSIEEALKEASQDCKVVIVDQDGEMCFHVYPSGQISLMLRWKSYQIIREEN